MTEDEARAWLAGRFDAAAVARLSRLVDLVVAEAGRQNLIAAPTLAVIWTRHVVDSAQLLDAVAGAPASWIDVGTGAGFPGLVIAALADWPMLLIEPRRRRADFLRDCAAALALPHVTVEQRRVEVVTGRQADVISARAVAGIDALFVMTAHLRHAGTRYLLPRGRHAADELADVQVAWQGLFHVKQSITDPDSAILVADRVRQR